MYIVTSFVFFMVGGVLALLPRVRSERPAFELHHPHMVDRLRTEAHPHRGWEPLQAAESGPHLAVGTASKDLAETTT